MNTDRSRAFAGTDIRIGGTSAVSSLEKDSPDSVGPSSSLARAFSLVELLVVVAILGMLMALTLPSMRSVLSANVITQGGQLVSDQLVFARQEAIAKNGDVAVRLCKFDDPNDARPGDVVGGLQSFRVKADGTREPLGRLARMPTGATISTNTALSGILLQTTFQPAGAQDPNLPGVAKNYAWVEVLFHADGSTSLPQDSSRTNNFLTVVNARDSEATPANYYSIMIESRNGRIKTFRP